MSRMSTVRRAQTLPVVASCKECHWYHPCGGYRDQRSLFGDSCFARHCCGGREDCNYLCPCNHRYAAMMNEVEALDFDALPELMQRNTDLPRYVPASLNHSRRAKRLDVPFAAVPVEEVFRTNGTHIEAVAQSPQGLRDYLGLACDTKIVLNCVRQDAKIERLWEFWLQDNLPDQLMPLGIEMVIGPNFSHLTGVPRLESVGNRMRHLICIRGFQEAGLLAVPHLSVVDPADWDWWRAYLTRNRQVRYVAFEFETGYKNAVEGADAILQLADIQQAINRELHLIVVGGTQFRNQVRVHFPACSFIDSSPFWNTISRQRAHAAGGAVTWEKWPLPNGAALDELLTHNVRVYTKWFAGQVSGQQAH
jgi:hypothetical protein